MLEIQRPLTPTDVVKEARKWVGTPWNAHGHIRGVGANCIAIHIGIAKTWGLSFDAIADTHAQILRASDWFMHTRKEYMVEAFEQSGLVDTVAIECRQPGDTLLFGFGLNPCSHAGVLSTPAPQERMIHIDFRRCITEGALGQWRQRLRVVLRLQYAKIFMKNLEPSCTQ